MLPRLETHYKKNIFRDHPWFVFVFGLVLGIAIFSAVNYFRLSSPGRKTNDYTDQPKITNFNISSADHIWGNSQADIQLVVFGDFTCGYCSEYFNSLKQLASDYGDKVAVVWRHFPLNKKGEANNAANAAECAGEQGKFWEMAELIYSHQENLSINFYYAQAEELSIDADQFKKCLDNRSYQDKIDSQYAVGIAKDVSGTPTSFLNGRVLLGALPYYDLNRLVGPLIQ